jgi:hypothetical protein
VLSHHRPEGGPFGESVLLYGVEDHRLVFQHRNENGPHFGFEVFHPALVTGLAGSFDLQVNGDGAPWFVAERFALARCVDTRMPYGWPLAQLDELA